jgi:SEC-C motif
MTVARNDPCPCGSGRKFKKCCAGKEQPTTAGLAAAIRMKGGVGFDPAANAYRAIVHSWNNAECIGAPREWQTAETFESEDAAMAFYKATIRPRLERLMDEASRKVKDGTSMRRRLE